jgi:hypothetical protein
MIQALKLYLFDENRSNHVLLTSAWLERFMFLNLVVIQCMCLSI